MESECLLCAVPRTAEKGQGNKDLKPGLKQKTYWVFVVVVFDSPCDAFEHFYT